MVATVVPEPRIGPDEQIGSRRDRRLPVIAGSCLLYMTGYTRHAIGHDGMLDAGARLLTGPFTVEELERQLRPIPSGVI